MEDSRELSQYIVSFTLPNSIMFILGGFIGDYNENLLTN